jgi:hypothetical protein
MSDSTLEPPSPNAFEIDRARWFYRLIYLRDGAPEEIDAFARLYAGFSTESMLKYATQGTAFHLTARTFQNIMLDSIYRKRSEFFTPKHISKIIPNLFVVGQPRSGTTSLYEYFDDHPDFFVPYIKETNYYSHYVKSRHGPGGLNFMDYLMYFVDAEQEIIRCDISPFYLSEPGVALNIFRDVPDSRIIMILRDPLELITSKFNLDHHIAKPGEIDNWIMKGIEQYYAGYPRWQHDSFATSLFHCRIASQVQEYFRYFGKNQRCVFIFGEMIQNQKDAYARICDFLGIRFLYPRKYWSWRSPGSAVPKAETLKELARLLRPEVAELESVLGQSLRQWYSRWPG